MRDIQMLAQKEDDCGMFLLDRKQGKLCYIIKSYLLVIACALSVAYIAVTIAPKSTSPSFGRDLETYLIAGFLGPLVETLLMIPVLFLIKHFTGNLFKTCLASAAAWALLHSSIHILWGVVVFASFFIYTIAFKVWEAESKKSGIIVAWSVHSLNNITALSLPG